MAFNLFKKKQDDDFNDFSTSQSAPRMESSVLDQTMGGLPRDGDITNTGINTMPNHNSNDLALPAEDDYPGQAPTSASQPTAFSDFNSEKSKRAFALSQQSANNDMNAEMNPEMHKPTRTELMTKVGNLEKDMEIVTAKLDTIKSILDSLTHKISHIEKAAGKSERDEVRW